MKQTLLAASLAVHFLTKSPSRLPASLSLSSTVVERHLHLKGGGSPKSKHDSHCPAQDVSVRLPFSTGRKYCHLSVLKAHLAFKKKKKIHLAREITVCEVPAVQT